MPQLPRRAAILVLLCLAGALVAHLWTLDDVRGPLGPSADAHDLAAGGEDGDGHSTSSPADDHETAHRVRAMCLAIVTAGSFLLLKALPSHWSGVRQSAAQPRLSSQPWVGWPPSGEGRPSRVDAGILLLI